MSADSKSGTQEDLMNKKQEPLTDALRRLATAQKISDKREPPTPRELMDYHDGLLDEEARAEVADYLALHPEATQEYLDLIEPSRLEEAPQKHAYSDRDVAQAFESLHRKMEGVGDSPTQAAASPEPARPQPRPESSSPSETRSLWWAVAALLGFVALGIWWLAGQPPATPSEPRFASVLDIQPTRGDRPLIVSPESETFLLLFHDIELPSEEEATLEITSLEHGVVLTRRIQARSAADELLYLALPRNDLPYGTYRATIYTGVDGARQVIQEYSLKLSPPP